MSGFLGSLPNVLPGAWPVLRHRIACGRLSLAHGPKGVARRRVVRLPWQFARVHANCFAKCVARRRSLLIIPRAWPEGVVSSIVGVSTARGPMVAFFPGAWPAGVRQVSLARGLKASAMAFPDIQISLNTLHLSKIYRSGDHSDPIPFSDTRPCHGRSATGALPRLDASAFPRFCPGNPIPSPAWPLRRACHS